MRCCERDIFQCGFQILGSGRIIGNARESVGLYILQTEDSIIKPTTGQYGVVPSNNGDSVCYGSFDWVTPKVCVLGTM